MGGRGSSMRGSQGMGGGTGAPAAAAQAMPTVRAAPAVQQAGPPTGATGFGHLTPQQVAAFENAAQQQMQRDPALAAGVVDYINPVMQSNGKALSQNANWAAANGLPLTKRQQAMMDAVDKLAKPIGQETTLYRADHDDFLKRLKVNNYQSMSDSQLRKALVGKTWTNDCLESTAYDSRDNPFWPQPSGRGAGKHGQGGIKSGNREVLIRQPRSPDPVPHRQERPRSIHPAQPVRSGSGGRNPSQDHRCPLYPHRAVSHIPDRQTRD